MIFSKNSYRISIRGFLIMPIVASFDSAPKMAEKSADCTSRLSNKLRILKWLPVYNRTAFISDLIAGITVGLTMMPQSIAYASIAELPPHVGLYTAIMGSFVYILFGTVKQVSIGPSSILSLLTHTYLAGKGMDYVILLSFLVGIVELAMGLLNLGVIVDFISAPVTSAFTSATSLIIIMAQFKNIFGIKFHSVGVFDLIKELVTHLPNAKLSDTLLGLTTMIFLHTVKMVSRIKFENERTNKMVWYLSICRNALIVLVGSIIAFICEHKTGYQPFVIAGKITPGLPAFKLPSFSTSDGNSTVPFTEMVETLGTSIFVLPVVAVLANVAIAKTFADGSVFDASQEMMTLGIANVMGAFVGAMPTTGAFTRSAVNNASNVQTPMGGLYAGTMILLALSFLTPYFYFIPKATIAGVLICAVYVMVEYWEVPRLWRCNKFDCAIFMVTFTSSMFVGVEKGIVIGVCMNAAGLLKIWARPKIYSTVRTNAKGTDYLVIKPELGIAFPSVNYLTDQVYKLSVIHSELPIAIDFKNVIRVDYTGCQAMCQIIKTFRKKSRQLVLLNINPNALKRMRTLTDIDDVDVRKSQDDAYDDIFRSAKTGLETPLLQKNIIVYNNERANGK